MDSSIFRFIMRYTLKQQLLILLLTVISLPFLYATLEVPKLIINEAIGGTKMPDNLLGYPVDQLSYLVILCFTFLLLTIINGGIKYTLNVYSGSVGERMLRRLRYALFTRILRFPIPHFKKVSQGEIIPIITAETEPLGGFIGEAFSLPAFQGGILFTYLFFIFQQDFFLGLAATALYPFQLYVIPKLQKRVNALGKQRVLAARKLGNRIGDTISGIQEVHTHDTSRYERAVISEHLGKIFHIRIEIFKKKFFIKFLNNFLAQVTPFFFYLFGGYYIITGELSLGALVAVLAAYKDLSSPWKELLKYYQTKEDVRIKYEQIIAQFNPENMFASELQDAPPQLLELHKGGWQSTNMVYAEQVGINILDQFTADIPLPTHMAVVGIGASGKEELGQLLSRLITPTQGKLNLAGVNIQELPEASIGHHIAYIDNNAHHFSGTIRDNLLYSLRHRQLQTEEDDPQYQREVLAAEQAGNSTDTTDGQWIDQHTLGLNESNTLTQHIRTTLSTCDLNGDVFQFGLLGKLDSPDNAELCNKILQARQTLHQKLQQEEYQGLVELFDWQHYNDNLTVLENILFSPENSNSNIDREALAGNNEFKSFLQEQNLLADLLAMGREVAAIMVDLFSDVDADSDLFERFSFIDADDLPEYRELVAQTQGRDLNENCPALVCQRFLSLSFKLCPARHRLGLLTDENRESIVRARAALAEKIDQMDMDLSFFDMQHFNINMSLQENMLFGKLVYGQAMAEEKITALIRQVIAEIDLEESIINVGLDYEVGTAGTRLSTSQRQKLAIARALIKMPDVIIMNDTTAALDPPTEQKIIKNLQEAMSQRSLIFISSRAEQARYFEKVMMLEKGRLMEQGNFEELSSQGKYFPALLSN